MLFSIVGILNTLIHGGLLIFFVDQFAWSPPHANVLAFLTANLFGFVAHSLVTFRVPVKRARYPLFLTTSLLGASLSYGISQLGVWLDWHYLLAFLLQVILMPAINYLLLRRFVFKD